MGRRTVLLLLLALLLAGGYIGWRMYNAKTPTAADASAQMNTDATSLFNAFNTDEHKADSLYVDKVVQVTGRVRSVTSEGAGPVNVTLETGDPMGGVVCEFVRDGAPAWKKDMQVTVKGFCAGFNMDVLLQRCAAVE